MRAVTYIYDSEHRPEHVTQVLDLLAEREETVERTDIGSGDREAGIRDAMLTTRSAVRIGTNPDGIYDDDGQPDFSAGVLITEQPTGRRELHVGTAARDALESDGDRH